MGVEIDVAESLPHALELLAARIPATSFFLFFKSAPAAQAPNASRRGRT